MGINAQYCVKSTAEDGIALGYKIVTSQDLISGQEHHDTHDDCDWFAGNGTLVTV